MSGTLLPPPLPLLLQVNGVTELFSVSTSLSLNSTLILSPLTPSHLASYTCHVSNPVHNNLDSEERTLAETSDPYVRDAAAGVQEVKFHNGTTLELVCEARGRSGDVLVWMSGGRELTNQTTAGGSLVIATNGNNSTLTIFGVTTREAGLYQCVMEGTMSKLAYNVTVTVPAKIDYTSNPFVTVAVGDQVQFDCVASGIPLPSIGWLFDVRLHLTSLWYPSLSVCVSLTDPACGGGGYSTRSGQWFSQDFLCHQRPRGSLPLLPGTGEWGDSGVYSHGGGGGTAGQAALWQW